MFKSILSTGNISFPVKIYFFQQGEQTFSWHIVFSPENVLIPSTIKTCIQGWRNVIFRTYFCFNIHNDDSVTMCRCPIEFMPTVDGHSFSHPNLQYIWFKHILFNKLTN